MSREDFFHLNDTAEISILSPAEGAVFLPDGLSSFKSEISREGIDLVLTGQDGAQARVVNYFDGTPADLIGMNGGVMSGPVVSRLAGPEAPGQYAQAGASAANLPIGQVEALDGTVTAQRADGTVVTLQVGSKVFADDVISTETGASASLTFVDGTIFTLAASSRMILDDLIYDADRTDNSAGFNLIEGGFVFIAGKVAGSGGMDVTTPTATMGIRGTTVSVDIQTEDGITTVQVALNVDPDGGIGKIELRDLDGNLLSTIESTDVSWIISPREGETREISRVLTDEAPEFLLLSEAIAAFQSAVSRVEDGGTFVELDSVGRDDPPPADGSEPGEFETETEDLNQDREVLPPVEPVGPGIETNRGSDERESTATRDANRAPEAADLRLDGIEDTETSGQIRAVDPEGSAVFYAVGTGPSDGAVDLRSDGSFDYTPNPNFSGADRFTVVVSDAAGKSSTIEVVVNVQPVNDAPVLNDAGLTTNEDNAITTQLVAIDPDGETPTLQLASGASNGTVVLLSNGAFTYTPDADFNGIDTFLVDAVDGAGLSTRAKVEITVNAVDDAPVVGGDTAGTLTDTGAFGASVSGTVTAIDPDSGASATWTGGGSGTYGSLAINPTTGAWTYTVFDTAPPSTSAVASPAAMAVSALTIAKPVRSGPILNLKEGETATDSFTVIALDNTGETGTKVIEITLTGRNDAPVISGVSTGGAQDTGNPGVLAEGTLTVADPDTDATASWTGNASGTYGSFEIDANSGQWTYRLLDTDADTRSLKADETATERFTVTVTDDKGATDTQIVEITVTGMNDIPNVTAISHGNVQETSAPVVLNLIAGQSDVDGDSLSAVSISVVDDLGASVVFTDNSDGTISIDPTQYAALNTGEIRTIKVNYSVSDGVASTPNSASFVIEGITPNAAPTAQDDVLKPAAARILVVATQSGEAPLVKGGLDALTRFDQVDIANQTTGITSASLATYDAVLTFSNAAYANADDYGDLLANFISDGGGVVAATYSFSDGMVKSGFLPDGTIGGAFETLSPFAGVTDLAAPVGDLNSVRDSDAIWDGVDVASLNGSFATNSNYALTTLNSGSTLIARYGTGSDGMLGIARNADGSVIGANIFPGQSATSETNLWTLFANMLDNVASRDLPEFTENTARTILASRLLGNDTDTDGDLSALFISSVAATSAKGAAVSLVAGNVVYDPTGSAVIDGLKEGETYIDTFTYTIQDADGGQSTGTVTLTVGGVDETTVQRVSDGVLDLTNGVSDLVTLNLSDVLDLPDTGSTELEDLLNPLDVPASGEDIVTILGDANLTKAGSFDQVGLEGVPTLMPDQVTLTDGSVLNLYSYNEPSTGDVLAVIGIDEDIAVTVLGLTT